MKDIQGKALQNYFYHQDTTSLKLFTKMQGITVVAEAMPVEIFFREEHDLPEAEKIALAQCDGKILDVGAGVGAHSLILQEREKDVTALEISPLSVKIMKERGVQNALQGDIFNYQEEKYDTILMMMNGIGLGGSLKNLQKLLHHLKTLLNPSGQIIFDSSDILYVYDDYPIPLNSYYGEVSFQYEYKGEKGAWFDWVYIDVITLKKLAKECGFFLQVIYEDYENNQYLGKLCC